MTAGQFDARSGRRIGSDIHRIFAEIDERKRADKEDGQNHDSKQGHDRGDQKGQLDASRIGANEDDVAKNPPQRLERGRRLENRREVSADEIHDHRRRKHIFDVLGDTGDKAAPWPEGGSRERIGAAGMRQRRTHLGDRIGEAEIHDRDDDCADEHAAPAAHGKAQVPAGKIPRNHRCDAERP